MTVSTDAAAGAAGPSLGGAASEDLPGGLLGAVRVLARLSRVLERSLAALDLTMPQYRLLALLADGSAGASALADRLAVSRPSVTGVVDGLVARGLVERATRPGDRRRVLHLLTEKGRAVLAEADAATVLRLGSLAQQLPEADRSDAIGALEAWRLALDRSLAALGLGRPPRTAGHEEPAEAGRR